MSLTPEQRQAKKYRNEQIIEDYRLGLSVINICKKYGVSDITYIVKKSGIKMRGKKPCFRRVEGMCKNHPNRVATWTNMCGVCRSEYRKRVGKRKKMETIPLVDTSERDRLWIEKQIIALTKQGCPTTEIKRRYNVNETKIAEIKKEAGILTGKLIHSANAKNVSEVPSMGDSLIPYADNCNVRPKRYSEHYSQVIFR